MLISNSFSGNQISPIASNRYTRQSTPTLVQASAFDTVSISEEAKQAYQNAKYSQLSSQQSKNTTEMFPAPDDKYKELKDKLVSFFNKHHSNSNAIIAGDAAIDLAANELLPENQAMRERLEAEITQIMKENPVAPFEVTPPEVWQKIQVPRSKNNALSALGSGGLVTEDVLAWAGNVLHKMENQWEKDNGHDNSLQTRFQSVIKGSGDTANNRLSEEEKIRKIKEEALRKMNAEG